ncbi:DegT/DnrJ/EryC1/StrS family aminotransferase [Streptomyces clavuligerus]|uniref:Pleiotropic regulatory protein n=1 Tax=Streptomyces clavuligerus TaxID=1901 RepID=B5GMF5_STRCL|nr:DegT/DnrJ/EryC1/StrS family aminotransferase [Streptomyces clavuligerus]ANW22370.1 glutamine--scyllo-inositol aminotransferase [Streptomyces clavuligerus]AXU17274.1 DegT/DnrJ/EryC1/StrS family aminotransferase [Streptomyces clavuligerus]EDY47501.1 pleiotropic regulatory protein [Streptomyces clavuligerus]EFG04461.1 Pleiotropic regulatory protein [Streptomyces clavuligerus]MBY6307081.1 DegT/DnrJ/EryC1/StrS family aminotransferase [Streptomyces clavuligerus]
MIVTKYHHEGQFPDLPALLTQLDGLLRSGEYILSAPVEQFEEDFAAYVGTRHTVGVNSGTDALVLALRALSVGPGHEVITVANTFHASALAITSVGARPALVDCTPDDFLMDLDRVEAAINEKTRAILAVHLFGKALDMDRLRDIADRHGLAVVEDCAQAVGARWAGRRVGSFGDAGCFSFHPSKNLAAAGDAGAVTTDRADIADALRVLRGLGQRTQNNHVVRGYNSKLDAVQALVLRHKLSRLDAWNDRRRELAARYSQDLSPHAAVPPPAGEEHVFHLYQVAVPGRDAVLAGLTAAGIEAIVRYPVPIHRQPAFADLSLGQSFPNAEHQAANTLCLPIHPDLTTAELTYVIDRFNEAAATTRGAHR